MKWCRAKPEKKRKNLFRVVSDKNSRTGLSAIAIMRDVKITGPHDNGVYKIVSRTFPGRYRLNLGGSLKQPIVKINVVCKTHPAQWQAEISARKLARARSGSPMLH